MKYISTRDIAADSPLGIGAALGAGLAPDGGLYVPMALPPFNLAAFDRMDALAGIAEQLLTPFFEGDPLASDLRDICNQAFDFPVPLTSLADGSEVIELFHGPTAAFKDFGARFLAGCLSRLRRDDDPEATILVATSGDTGAAVAAAFHRKPGFKVVILYPDGLISPRQAHGLECWGDNVSALRVAGTFDDCQRLVKTALADQELRGAIKLLSANSISLGRWLPQASYYAYSALRNLRQGKDALRLIVPTGNLGNAMAALLLHAAGWPIAKVGLACNANRTLADYYGGGAYRPRPAIHTIANAMDVGAPSNFERLQWLYPYARGDGGIQASSFHDDRIKTTITAAERLHSYVPCPHTACAFAMLDDLRAAGDQDSWTLCATAHPAKFDTVVEPLIGRALEVPPSIEAMLARPAKGQSVSADYQEFASILRG